MSFLKDINNIKSKVELSEKSESLISFIFREMKKKYNIENERFFHNNILEYANHSDDKILNKKITSYDINHKYFTKDDMKEVLTVLTKLGYIKKCFYFDDLHDDVYFYSDEEAKEIEKQLEKSISAQGKLNYENVCGSISNPHNGFFPLDPSRYITAYYNFTKKLKFDVNSVDINVDKELEAFREICTDSQYKEVLKLAKKKSIEDFLKKHNIKV